MSFEVPELPPKQLKAAICISKGGSNKEAAETVGCTEKTIGRWIKQPEFQEGLLILRKIYHDSLVEEFRQDVIGSSKQMLAIANNLLTKIESWSEDIDFDSMSHASILKTITETRSLLVDALAGKEGAYGITLLREKYLDAKK